MKNLMLAVDAATGGNQKQFAQLVGIDKILLNKMIKGHVNPLPFVWPIKHGGAC